MKSGTPKAPTYPTLAALQRSRRRTKVFGTMSLVAALAAFALMFAFGPLWGLPPVLLFAVFAMLY